MGPFLLFPSEFSLEQDEGGIVGVMFQPDIPGHVSQEARLIFPDGSQQAFRLQGQGVAIDLELLPVPVPPSPLPPQPRLTPLAATSASISGPSSRQPSAIPSAANETPSNPTVNAPVSRPTDPPEPSNSDAGLDPLDRTLEEKAAQAAGQDGLKRPDEGLTAVTTAAAGAAEMSAGAAAEDTTPPAALHAAAAAAAEAARAAPADGADVIQRGALQTVKNGSDAARAAAGDKPIECLSIQDADQAWPGARGECTMWMGEVTVGVTVEGQQHVSNHGALPLPYEWVIEELSLPPLPANPPLKIAPAAAPLLFDSDAGDPLDSSASQPSCASSLDASDFESGSDLETGRRSEDGGSSLGGSLTRANGGPFGIDGEDGSEEAEECPFSVQPDYGDLAAAATTRFSFSFQPKRPGR